MSARSSLAGFVRRLPFGIGTVTMLLIAAMVATVGVVLAIGSPTDSAPEYTDGRLRGYVHEPEVAWSQSSDTLPGYGEAGGIEIADTWRDRWLLSYPSGLGRAYLLVAESSGKPLWDKPVVAGLGGCAINDTGQVGCAVKLGGAPDGFYLVDADGVTASRTDLDDTKQVVGVGSDYLRIDQAGYRVTLRTPTGVELWSRTFATAAQARIRNNGILTVSTADGTRFVLDPETGKDRLSCTQCTITAFDSGITVQYDEFEAERVVSYAVDDGALRTPPVTVSAGLRVLAGPAVLPVLTGTGDSQVQVTQGRYEIRDPARAEALWQITDPELSKANTRPCGTQVAFALKDRSRLFYDLADGTRVGRMEPPAYDDPGSNIDQLSCVGSSGTTLVFADANQVTAVDAVRGDVAWTRQIIGNASALDGYIILREGASITVLRPN
ncbi:hypothetical protein [Gordonia insulae]|nr:hypothetical protein [Gordonia insulae]